MATLNPGKICRIEHESLGLNFFENQFGRFGDRDIALILHLNLMQMKLLRQGTVGGKAADGTANEGNEMQIDGLGKDHRRRNLASPNGITLGRDRVFQLTPNNLRQTTALIKIAIGFRFDIHHLQPKQLTELALLGSSVTKGFALLL